MIQEPDIARRQHADSKRKASLWILVAALCVGILCGVLGALSPIEAGLHIMRNKLRGHPVSGDIVIVAIDDSSVAEFGQIPWPRSRLAQVVDRVREAGARRIYIEADVSTPASAEEDLALESALGAGKPQQMLLQHRFSIDPVSGSRLDSPPLERFARHGQAVNTNLVVLARESTIWNQPYGVAIDGHFVPSLASIFGGAVGGDGELFPIDYAIDVRSLPLISASDVLRDTWKRSEVAGKDVVIGQTSSGVAHYNAPGYAMVPGIFFHVLAAETLRTGRPVELPWPVPLVFGTVIACAFLFLRNRIVGRSVLVGGLLLVLLVPFVLEHYHIFMVGGPALALLVAAGAMRTWSSLFQSYRNRGLTNSISGLPNLNALRQEARLPTATVIVAHVRNFVEIIATLPTDSEGELVDQIASRIGFGAAGAPIFQADEGIFIWLSDDDCEDTLIEHLDGLHALFRSPIVVATRLVDVSITFGMDRDRSRPILQRFASARIAAEEAALGGRRWLTFDPANLADAEWRISLLGRLDQAIENGEIWVAYQPKLDLATGRIVGAEGLARWTHPEKGEISPNQFIPAAEQSERIETLTRFVLDAAVGAAAAITKRHRPFGIAVNLSARLLGRPDLMPMVQSVLAKHRFPPTLLTLEVTETAAMASPEASLENLQALAMLGVQLSIDDYGTGFSTLEYLRKVPAVEIKIDRSFISMLDKSQNDRIMVNSTIQLAHSLGRKTVAEGVENAATYDELSRMGCDFVQGYYTGRPMPLTALFTILNEEKPGSRLLTSC
ncbi:EAL domain-containing protein [Allosphingosinicella humi]